MAGFIGAAAHHNTQNPPPLSHQKKRVSFSEIPHKQNMYEEEPNYFRRQRRSRGCSMCCAWMCIIITALLIILFVLGFIAVGFLRSSLPKIYVSKVHSPRISITESARQKFLNMDVNIAVQFDNKNEKTSLHYKSLRADVTAEQVKIGHTTIPGFSQKPGNETKLDVNTTTASSRIDDANAEVLKMRNKENAVMVDLYMSGDVSFSFGGLKVKDLPFEVSCQRINEAYLKPLDPQKCFTKLLSFRGL